MTTDATQRRGIAARAIAELVEQLWHATSNCGFTTGLNPAQWTALRYLDRVSEIARTLFVRSDEKGLGPVTQALIRSDTSDDIRIAARNYLSRRLLEPLSAFSRRILSICTRSS